MSNHTYFLILILFLSNFFLHFYVSLPYSITLRPPDTTCSFPTSCREQFAYMANNNLLGLILNYIDQKIPVNTLYIPVRATFSTVWFPVLLLVVSGAIGCHMTFAASLTGWTPTHRAASTHHVYSHTPLPVTQTQSSVISIVYCN